MSTLDNAISDLQIAPKAVCMADVEPEYVEFVWGPYIPLRKVTLVEGDPGLGKSQLSTAIVSALSLGHGLPETDEAEPEPSLLFSAEDGLADTLRPRLDAMGADVSRVFASPDPIDLTQEADWEVVRSMVREVRPRLVVLDPIVAYLGSTTDIHRANQVRAVMAPIAGLAEEFDCAVLAIRHLTKGGRSKAIYRGQGSIDFTAAARSVLLVGANSANPDDRAIVHIKSNLAAPGRSLGYSLDGGRFIWKGHSRLTAGDLLAEEPSADTQGAATEAEEFLEEILAEGRLPAKEVLRLARESGIPERTLQRAKKSCGVRSRREGFGKGSTCYWELIGSHTLPSSSLSAEGKPWQPMQSMDSKTRGSGRLILFDEAGTT